MSCSKIVKRGTIEEVEMDLTGTCNLRCPLCTRNYAHAQHLIKPNQRPIEEVIAQLDSFTGLELFYLAGNFSEPTLYKDIFKLCQYLVDRGVAIDMFTNGSTHNEEFWAKLGEIFTSNDKVYFTVCGSNQKLHETYRVGSSLEKLLKNHQAFKKANKCNIDYIQHIMFEYNREDLDSKEMKELMATFSNVKLVDTEGQRTLNEYVKSFDSSIVRPHDERKRAIDSLFKIKPSPGNSSKVDIKCMSLRDKKIYIDQFGRISPCYGNAEFEGPGLFSEHDFDYSEVLSFKYRDCFKCESRIQKFIDVMGLDFVC